MGIFDRIKKAVKKVTGAVSSIAGKAYRTADKAVGGALPGGVKPSKTVSKIGSTIKKGASKAYDYAKRDIKGETFTKNLDGTPKLDKDGNPITLQMGTVPIGPGGFGSTTKAFGMLGKTKEATNVAGLTKGAVAQIKRLRNIKDAQNAMKGIYPGDSKWAVFGKTVLDNLKANPVKWVAGITIGGVVAVDKFAWGPGELASWAAVDNIAGMVSFTSGEINTAYQDRDISKEEGEEFYTEAFGKLDSSESYVRSQMRINPKLKFGAGKQLILAIDTARARVELNQQLFNEINPLEETYQERQDRRDLEFDEKQNLRDQEYENSQLEKELSREQDEDEDDAEFRERTLLFEAIRKRNSGQTLTEEEIALLIKYGLDPKPLPQWEGGSSSLGFGLL